jgi:dolichol-phosphate mannosyltransferase
MNRPMDTSDWDRTAEQQASPSLTIVVPTFNERENIAPFIEQLSAALVDERWELVIVDDNSPDKTAEEVRSHARHQRNIRVIQRMRNHGLSKSVIDGVQAAMNDVVIVMDADLQHDAMIIPRMVSEISSSRADIVIGSRFKDGRSADGLSSRTRSEMSRLGNVVLNWLMSHQLTDPLTGFFAVRRSLFLNTLSRIEGSGYKILFDLLYCNPHAKVQEIGFNFAARRFGESKLSIVVLWQFGMQIAERVSQGWLPYRFSSFLCIGAIGSVVHIATFIALREGGADTLHAQTGATLSASLLNYTLHNFLTYYDIRKKGSDFWLYFIVYLAISSFGILANISVALVSIDAMRGTPIIGALAGYLIDIVWKYSLVNMFVWRQRGRE